MRSRVLPQSNAYTSHEEIHSHTYTSAVVKLTEKIEGNIHIRRTSSILAHVGTLSPHSHLFPPPSSRPDGSLRHPNRSPRPPVSQGTKALPPVQPPLQTPTQPYVRPLWPVDDHRMSLSPLPTQISDSSLANAIVQHTLLLRHYTVTLRTTSNQRRLV